MSGTAQNESLDWRRLYPFESHWMAFPDGRMHYLDEGPAAANGAEARECLLFVHGNPTWSFHWRQLVQELRGRYRCLAPDHLGCGLSDKPRRFFRLDEHVANLAAFVERLHLDRDGVTLIAQDWGGAIGLGAMLAAPSIRAQLNGIVLFNTGAFPPRYIPWRIRACRVPFLGRLAVQGGNLFSRTALRMTLSRRQRLEPDVAAGYLAPYDTWANRRAVYGFVRDIPNPRRRVSPKLASESRRDSPTCSTWRLLAEIERGLPTFADVPATLIWGMRDWCFRPDSLDRFVQAWPQAEVHRLADVGHWVVEDAPEESLAFIERFLSARTAKKVAGTLRVP